MQEDAVPAEQPEDLGREEEASEDGADMDDREADEEQHQRMLEEIRAAGRPASSRRPKQVQTESVPESALNVGPMTDLPGMPAAHQGSAAMLPSSSLLRITQLTLAVPCEQLRQCLWHA